MPGTRGTPGNWNIGGSSILAHALALAPFKDNYWTNSSEPGGSCGDALEPGVALHSAVSTLSVCCVGIRTHDTDHYAVWVRAQYVGHTTVALVVSRGFEPHMAGVHDTLA